MELYTAEPSSTEPSALEVKNATEKFERYKSPDTDKILTEVIQEGGETLHCEIYELIHSIWNKLQLLQLSNKPIIVPIYKNGDKTSCNSYWGILLLSTSYKILFHTPPSK